MKRRRRCSGVVGALFVSTVQALAAQGNPNVLRIRVGPFFQGHTDLLATPFRQHGTGFALGFVYRRGGLWIDLGGGVASTSSALEGPDLGVEDVWNVGFEVGHVRPTPQRGRVGVRVGASLAALAFVRRHHYGPTVSREFFGDLVIPLSAVGEVGVRLGSSTRLEERAEAAIASVLLRSSFAGTKGVPEATFAAPWELVLLRNRLALERAVSSRFRLALAHAVTVYATDRSRTVRLFRHDLTVGLTLIFGGGDR